MTCGYSKKPAHDLSGLHASVLGGAGIVAGIVSEFQRKKSARPPFASRSHAFPALAGRAGAAHRAAGPVRAREAVHSAASCAPFQADPARCFPRFRAIGQGLRQIYPVPPRIGHPELDGPGAAGKVIARRFAGWCRCHPWSAASGRPKPAQRYPAVALDPLHQLVDENFVAFLCVAARNADASVDRIRDVFPVAVPHVRPLISEPGR